MEIYLARTQGFCSGVAFAINILEKALCKYGSPLYAYHDIVHNTHVVNSFKKKGICFVEEIKNVPQGQRIIFSAHGVPPSVVSEAKNFDLKIIDATCPLVTKVHREAVKFSKMGCQVILMGHKGHQELIGTAGYVDEKFLHIVENEGDIDQLEIKEDEDVAFITQTTLSVEQVKKVIIKLKGRFTQLRFPHHSDLCYATQNRQDAVKELSEICDIIIICGSPNSSNSNRLRETGQKAGIESHIIDSASELDLRILRNKDKIGISSGASVPRIIVDDLVSKIRSEYHETIVYDFENPEKNITFVLPEI